ncbi:MAG: UDP-N-acetylmuramoyl-L-alanine--D-glutamate ligase [Syntrophales bacterium]
MMDLSGRKVLVIGLGKTGIETVRFLSARGSKIEMTDEKPAAELAPALRALGELREPPQMRPYGEKGLDGIDLVIPSPGVPPSNPLLREAVAKRVPVLSELEVAFRFLRVPVIAITGTNGKTTTTTLIGKILSASGLRVFVGGNIGNPLIGYAAGAQEDDYAVVEVSSFQLQWIETFKPRIAVLLNITRDHVDYHGTFEEYRKAKERIFENQGAGDLAILNADDPASVLIATKIRARVKYFSSTLRSFDGIYMNHECLISRERNGAEERFPLRMIRIPGRHNIENVMASVLTARQCGCAAADIVSAVSDFAGVSHRIEFAGEKRGIAFYDDSKGTNVGAVVRAVESFSKPVILLLGGRDKGGDFEILSPLIHRHVKELVLFGEARDRIRAVIGGLVRTRTSSTLKEAVETAYRDASPGDIILLSPGCASFDEFANYAERGNFFKETVERLSDV